MKTIVLTGGGTAGHVTPHLALLPRLQADGWETHYIGSRAGIEKDLIALHPRVHYHGIDSGKLRRYFSIKNLTDPFRVIWGFFEAFRLIHAIKPGIVFSKGGFVAVPVVAAAFFLGVPVLAHESDLTPGLANRVSALFAKQVATTFPECTAAIGKKGVCTGTPMREELFSGSRENGLALAGFDGKKPVLLVMGGSQGAQKINDTLREALPLILPQMDVLHLCGKGKLDEAYTGTPGYFQAEYLDLELPHALAAADLVLSRAGATAIGEFLALKKPMLLVPWPKGPSRGDQVKNADNYVSRGLALVLPQADLTPGSLAQALSRLRENASCLISAMEKAPPPFGNDDILRLIDQLRKKR